MMHYSDFERFVSMLDDMHDSATEFSQGCEEEDIEVWTDFITKLEDAAYDLGLIWGVKM